MGLTDMDLEELLSAGAIKLEVTGGIPTWEASPSSRHQWMVRNIERSIRPSQEAEAAASGYECEYLVGVYIHFADGSIKRADIAIFSTMPPIQDEALDVTPQAVIEIISPGYEFKDTMLNPQFYLTQDVGDVVVVDPRSGVVTHYRTSGVAVHQAPVTIELLCGCRCSVPGVGGDAA